MIYSQFETELLVAIVAAANAALAANRNSRNS
jgi:hypothetical protein